MITQALIHLIFSITVRGLDSNVIPNISFYEQKLRIVGLNLFEKGISPKWEDPHNRDGRTLILTYQINEKLEEFLNQVQNYWVRLILYMIGESVEGNRYVRVSLI
jgi:hypothetical protein